MDERRIQMAMEALYEDEGVTDELDDNEAEMFLQWGQQQVLRLAQRAGGEEGFRQSVQELRQLMKRINRFTGLRHDMSEDEHQQAMTEMVTLAQTLGYPLTSAHTSGYLQQQSAMENPDALRELMSLIIHAPTEADASAGEEDTPPPASDTGPEPGPDDWF